MVGRSENYNYEMLGTLVGKPERLVIAWALPNLKINILFANAIRMLLERTVPTSVNTVPREVMSSR